jgi:hypothetical protein
MDEKSAETDQPGRAERVDAIAWHFRDTADLTSEPEFTAAVRTATRTLHSAFQTVESGAA